MPNKLELSGKKFGMLTVLEDSGKRKGSSVLWCCLCDCGTTTFASSTELSVGIKVNCGCIPKTKNNDYIKQQLMKPQMNNTSGVRGIYLKKRKGGANRWTAVITLNGRQYYLGAYRNFSAAVKAREEALEHVGDSFAEWHKEWRKKTKRTRGSPDPV
ncbi:hypothetical protein [Clostridium merdae]|uniref:hypothetical protein n=1 Tax=Clostridium merdae TaxID=1958780 RepID=UPI000A268F47|nr:hypothetical protein [Clostridium merdae]